MVEFGAGAIALVVVSCLVRAEVFADVPMLPPLTEHERRHLLAERLNYK